MRRLVYIAMMLTSCSTQPYWTLQNAPVDVLHVVYVDYPCGVRHSPIDKTQDHDYGCWNAAAQTVELSRGMVDWKEKCVLRHEGGDPKEKDAGHAAGWVHDKRYAYVLDCGPTRAQIEAAKRKQ